MSNINLTPQYKNPILPRSTYESVVMTLDLLIMHILDLPAVSVTFCESVVIQEKQMTEQ